MQIAKSYNKSNRLSIEVTTDTLRWLYVMVVRGTIAAIIVNQGGRIGQW